MIAKARVAGNRLGAMRNKANEDGFKLEVSSVKARGPHFGQNALRRHYKRGPFPRNKANLHRDKWMINAVAEKGYEKASGNAARRNKANCRVSGSTLAPGGEPSRGRLGYTVHEPAHETKPISQRASKW